MTHLWSKLSDRASVCGRAWFTDRLTWDVTKVTCIYCDDTYGTKGAKYNKLSTPYAHMNRLSGE